jgi:hypothetical protein
MRAAEDPDSVAGHYGRRVPVFASQVDPQGLASDVRL